MGIKKKCKAVTLSGTRCRASSVLGGFCVTHYQIDRNTKVSKYCVKYCPSIKGCLLFRKGEYLKCDRWRLIKREVNNNLAYKPNILGVKK